MQTIERNRKTCNDLILHGYNNVLKCSHGKSEGQSHRLAKFIIANLCWEANLNFSSEVTLKGGRADIVVKDWGLIIEILSSEEWGKFATKKYPLPVIPIKIDTTAFMDWKKIEELNMRINKIFFDLLSSNGANFQYYINQNH